MPINTPFLSLARLSEFIPWPGMLFLICLFLSIVFLFCFFVVMPYVSVYRTIRAEQALKAKKRSKLGEFIVMKEIQGEIEKEMEESLISNFLKNNPKLSKTQNEDGVKGEHPAEQWGGK